MYLKRCEMIGFKTFADKVEMEFGPGITGIVGPNGSGKSNITDALRFCLGEASVRTLRGNRMEELIFAGSGTRSPSGMAEVTVVFDNQDGYFPLEFSEVSFTRRLFRGGDTQYFINKSPARLKDIHDLLAGTGLGHGSICMLGAREMQMVLSPDCQDRKLVLEEASGVLKYKNRKREAARKLDQVRDNLLRLHDILREVNSGLVTAEHQLERYRRYKRTEERLRRLEVGVAGSEMERLRLLLEEVLRRGEQAGRLSHEAGQRMAVLEAGVSQRRETMARTDDTLQTSQEERRQEAIDLERACKEVALLDERAKNLERDREKNRLRAGRLREQEAQLATQQEAIRAQLELVGTEVERWDEQVHSQEKAMRELDGRSVERSRPYQEAVTGQAALGKEQATLRARIESAGERARRALERAAALEVQTGRAGEEQHRHGSQHEEKSEEVVSLQAAYEALDAELAALKARRAQMEQAAQAGGREFEKVEDAYHQRSSRLGALMEIEDDYQGFNEGVRYLLRRPQRPEGVIGVLSECVVAEREHARAIEAALGGHAQDVLVEGKHHAKDCIGLLKRERAGKVTFWPLDLSRPEVRRPDMLRTPGIVGWAPELVRYESRFDGVVKALLGRTVVVENLDVATELYESLVRRRGFIPMLVTLDGDVLAPGGSMSGGAFKQAKAGPVQRRAELEALEKEVEELRVRFLRIKEARRRHDQELIEIRTRQDEIRAEAQKTAQRLAELQRTASVAQSRAESVASEVARLQKDAATAREEALQAEAEQQRLVAELEEKARHEEALVARLQDFELQREEHRGQRAELVRALEELKEKRAKAMRLEGENAQKLRFVSERRSELAREAREIGDEVYGQGGQVGTLSEARERAAAAVVHHTDRERELSVQCEALQAERVRLSGELDALESELTEVSRAHQERRDELHACEVERARYQATHEEHRLRMEELDASATEVREAVTDIVDREKAVIELNRLRQAMRSFGNVNLGAADDYEQLKARHDTMSEQIHDLEEASASLRSVMNEMDEASVKQFSETFRKVKGEFTIIFQELYNGGHAELTLTEPENLLETGVDIVAQPPGKRLQNLSLLSSGEKALTAIAFLLAILKARPSPFVVLDELDAPLDDTNVERVARKFEEFAVDTQFITITHNRKTMEYARVLYGVTMVDPGVSKLVAVSLEEARRDDYHPPQPSVEKTAGMRGG